MSNYRLCQRGERRVGCENPTPRGGEIHHSHATVSQAGRCPPTPATAHPPTNTAAQFMLARLARLASAFMVLFVVLCVQRWGCGGRLWFTVQEVDKQELKYFNGRFQAVNQMFQNIFFTSIIFYWHLNIELQILVLDVWGTGHTA